VVSGKTPFEGLVGGGGKDGTGDPLEDFGRTLVGEREPFRIQFTALLPVLLMLSNSK